jgi:hypothetical protein
MKSSELKELVFLLYSKQCVTVRSRVLLEKLILVQLAILRPQEVAPMYGGDMLVKAFSFMRANAFPFNSSSIYTNQPKVLMASEYL